MCSVSGVVAGLLLVACPASVGSGGMLLLAEEGICGESGCVMLGSVALESGGVGLSLGSGKDVALESGGGAGLADWALESGGEAGWALGRDAG